MDMVRVSESFNGLWNQKYLLIFEYKSKRSSARVIAWKSKMSKKSGNCWSLWNQLFGRKMKVASIPIGYSHGYSRSLNNQGGSVNGVYVWIGKYEYDDC
jgi:alanine racemase